MANTPTIRFTRFVRLPNELKEERERLFYKGSKKFRSTDDRLLDAVIEELPDPEDVFGGKEPFAFLSNIEVGEGVKRRTVGNILWELCPDYCPGYTEEDSFFCWSTTTTGLTAYFYGLGPFVRVSYWGEPTSTTIQDIRERVAREF